MSSNAGIDLEGRCFVRRGNTLVPADIHADAWLHEIKEGAEIIIDGYIPRNPAFHRWFFAMIHQVCHAVEEWPDEDEMLWSLKKAVGHVRRYRTFDGEISTVPKSIRVSALGGDKFKRFVDRCLFVIYAQFGIDAEALIKSVDHEQGTQIAKRKKTRKAQ